MEHLQLFSKELPGLRLVHDATSLTAAWTCPQKYYRQMVQGVGRGGTSKHLLFGKALHRGLEVLHNARWTGAPADECLNAALKAALEATGWVEVDGVWQPWRSLDKKKNVYTMLRTLTWYADDLARGEGGQLDTMTLPGGPVGHSTLDHYLPKPATELHWQWKLPWRAVTGEDYWLVGNIDRIVEWDGERWPMEVKTTGSDLGARFWEGWNPNIQIKTYDLGIAMTHPEWECAGTLLEAHQIGVGFSRWSRTPLRYAAATREEWLTEVQLKLQELERIAQAGLVSEAPLGAVWPNNYTACHGYGDGCPLRNACRLGWQEREELLRSQPAQPWDPMHRDEEAAEAAT